MADILDTKIEDLKNIEIEKIEYTGNLKSYYAMVFGQMRKCLNDVGFFGNYESFLDEGSAMMQFAKDMEGLLSSPDIKMTTINGIQKGYNEVLNLVKYKRDIKKWIENYETYKSFIGEVLKTAESSIKYVYCGKEFKSDINKYKESMEKYNQAARALKYMYLLIKIVEKIDKNQKKYSKSVSNDLKTNNDSWDMALEEVKRSCGAAEQKFSEVEDKLEKLRQLNKSNKLNEGQKERLETIEKLYTDEVEKVKKRVFENKDKLEKIEKLDSSNVTNTVSSIYVDLKSVEGKVKTLIDAENALEKELSNENEEPKTE